METVVNLQDKKWVEEIHQNGECVIKGTAGSLPSFFNNLIGKNFKGKKYRDYVKFIAIEELGFEKGTIQLYCNGKYMRSGTIK